MPNLETVLAGYCEQYGKSEDWEGLASDLLLTLGGFIDVDTIAHCLTANLLQQLADHAELDAADEATDDMEAIASAVFD